MNGGLYWLASYPKSGNTWFRIFIENLLADGERPADINHLSIGHAANRAWLDDLLGFASADLGDDAVEPLWAQALDWYGRTLRQPVYLKIHDAFAALAAPSPSGVSGTRGALYLLRNPLDVVPSLANHYRCDLDAAITLLGDRRRELSPNTTGLRVQLRQRLGDWSGHVLGWVDGLGERCHVVRYEDLLAAPLETFRAAARFLQLPDAPSRVAKAIRFSAFDELARQEAASGFRERLQPGSRFFDKGLSGQGRLRLSAAQVERIVAAHGAVMQRFGYLTDDLRVAP